MSRIILFCLIYVTTLISGIHWSDFFFPNTESVKLSSEEWRCWMNIADNDTAKIKYLISLIMSWRCISCIFNRSFCPQLQWGVGTFKVHSLWQLRACLVLVFGSYEVLSWDDYVQSASGSVVLSLRKQHNVINVPQLLIFGILLPHWWLLFSRHQTSKLFFVFLFFLFNYFKWSAVKGWSHCVCSVAVCWSTRLLWWAI